MFEDNQSSLISYNILNFTTRKEVNVNINVVQEQYHIIEIENISVINRNTRRSVGDLETSAERLGFRSRFQKSFWFFKYFAFKNLSTKCNQIYYHSLGMKIRVSYLIVHSRNFGKTEKKRYSGVPNEEK